MKISDWNAPGDDRRLYFGTEKANATIKRRQRQRGTSIIHCSKSKIPQVVTQQTLLLIVLLFCLQNECRFALATRGMSSTVSSLSRRSLSFVVGKNGHRTCCALVPCPPSSTLPRQALSTMPMLRMEAPPTQRSRGALDQGDQLSRFPSQLFASGSSDNNPQIRNEKLRSALEEYRIEQSKALGKSPSVILPDNVVDGICALSPSPSTIEDLSKVRGFGAKKLELFGTGILNLVASSVAPKASKSVDENIESLIKATINSDFSPEPSNVTTTKSKSGTETAPVSDRASGNNTTLQSSNTSMSITTTDSIIQRGTKEKSKYSKRFGINESLVQEQRRSNSNITVARTESSIATKEETESSTSSKIEKETVGENSERLDEKSILRSNLEHYRMGQSKIVGKSPRMILNEKVIDGICNLDPLPTTLEDLSKVKGLGAKKLELFGETILRIASSKSLQTDTEEKSSASGFLAHEFLGSKSGSNDGDKNIYNKTSIKPSTPLPSLVDDSTFSSSPSISPAEKAQNKSDSHNNSKPSIQTSKTFAEESGNMATTPALDLFIAPAPYSAPKSDESEISFDSYTAPAPYSAPDGGGGIPALDSFVAPAPYSDPNDHSDIAAVDSFVSSAPFSAPGTYTGIDALDSYVAPAPYSFDDEEDDDEADFEDYEIGEESFGSSSSTPTSDTKEVKDTMTTTKLRKTQLKKDLKEYRLAQKDDGKAAYTVFTNAALDGIYASLPVTKSELLGVKGIGPKKLDLYGDDILAIVAPYAGMGGKKEADNPSGDTNTPAPRQKVDPKTLTGEQRKAADIIFGKDLEEGREHRRNVFVTGSAGTGKSHLLKYVVETLQGRKNLVVGVCAPTGVAAVIVGGSTLHSFFGIGLGTGTKSNLLKKVRQNNAAKTRIDETEVLIIDECSMLSAELLETLDMVARNVRRDGMFSDVPFGGMQVIAFGDFFQLPPVHKYDGSQDRSWRPFCFDSSVWADLGLSENIIELSEVQRQEEGDFVNLLNKVRTGRVEPRDIFELNEKCLVGPNNPLPNDGILPTRLYVLNRDVDSENSMRLEELSGKEVICTAHDIWRHSLGTPAAIKKKMKESMSMQMPDEVKLKVGAQVMLTRNKDLEKNLVNGSRGVVEGFETNRDGNPIPVVRFDSGVTIRVDPVEFTRNNSDGGEGCLVRMQVPLKLAWAVTIHKSQGSTLTRASLDISSAFEYGQCYVALSRVRSLDGLWLERPAELRNVMVSPQVMDFFSKNNKQ